MYQFFVDQAQIDIENKTVLITGADVNHIKNVLRMKVGEELAVSNGQDGKEYRCAIRAFHEKGEPAQGHGPGIAGGMWQEAAVDCELRFIKEDGVELPAKIYLFQGLPKADKLELIIQKAVELGVYQVIPVETKRSIVKLDEKKAKAKTARWQQISEAAAKQSKRGIIPEVTEPMSFSKALKLAETMDVKLIPYELAEGMEKTRRLIENIKPGQSIAIFIGPEGGFDEAEIQAAEEAGIEPITLGRRILRTETAPLAILAWLGYQLEV
ncbi:MAG: 16S rRNA (uracil(1498)-N(3))-methyltransferase [Lachnospiraceae bacterium]|nr:16S rRNA (uracil(1498)-N(3))-methyltransferase [Lachnospiraceae bacterium]